jgi:hypothetical protein
MRDAWEQMFDYKLLSLQSSYNCNFVTEMVFPLDCSGYHRDMI